MLNFDECFAYDADVWKLSLCVCQEVESEDNRAVCGVFDWGDRVGCAAGLDGVE